MTERTRVVVVGGGVIGCAILRELRRHRLDALLVEAAGDVGEGASKANSGIIHTGFDATPGSIEASLLRRAADLWPATLMDLEVPYLRVGALMVARSTEEAERLRADQVPKARGLGVRCEFLDRTAARHFAPYLSDDMTAALWIPDESIVDPFWLTRAYADAARADGATIVMSDPVVGLQVADEHISVRLGSGRVIQAEQVIDAAGLMADEVARLAGDDSFEIRPRKGQFLVSEETFGIDHIILPIPGPSGKGMLVTPIVFGGVLLGPTAEDQADKGDRSTDAAGYEKILASCRSLVPAVDGARPIRSFAGLRTVSSTDGYIVRRSLRSDRVWIAAGIRSTGISTSPALAELVVGEVATARGWPRASRPAMVQAPPFALDEAPGEVVCLCRDVSRGEIVAACRRVPWVATLDAIKRRSGAMFGDCQGNLCSLDIAALVAAERGVSIPDITKSLPGSWLAAPGRTPTDSRPSPARPPAATGGLALDVVVIGAGRAGCEAARSCETHGLHTLVVERLETPSVAGTLPVLAGHTAVGLEAAGRGWTIWAHGRDSVIQISARAVIVATGGYVEPREHRRIEGDRPTGIVTSQFVEQALTLGLVPGHDAIVVGTGPTAERLVRRLGSEGIRVRQIGEAPNAVRGQARLNAIRIGARWEACDTLVLADRMLAQTFILRQLGVVDRQPGSRAQTDGDGRLHLEGLWAVGCCVSPDIDHLACAEMGARVGRAVAVELRQPG
ncbi:MAG: FAD-dependent oxidoreductase [Chloroflexota bacterium]|nr:FAD-dependent oxidoreductase [Chloroflexota bacterium]